MIGTFWNMCRACPSLPVDKLHSEYRSTYRWHEYTGPRQEVVRRPPHSYSSEYIPEPALPRRKKHPELAYKTHDLFFRSGSAYDRARSEERWASSHDKNSRRSKSEGPQARKPSYRLISTRPINTPYQSSGYGPKTYCNDRNKAPINSSAFNNRNTIIQSEVLRTIQPKRDGARGKQPSTANFLSLRTDDGATDDLPKKSTSMSGLKSKEPNPQETAPVHKKTVGLLNHGDVYEAGKSNADPEANNYSDDAGASKYDDVDGEFKSEYKKNFQPFNRYDYDENKGVFEKRPSPIAATYSTASDADPQSLAWYKEVVHLRQKANQYRHRGWGTELIPEHIAQLYNNQMMVWEQVSRRSTLSALSLASTVSSRNQSPSKDDKENRRSSPMKSLTRAKSAKSGHVAAATHPGKSEGKKKGGPVKSSTVESSPKKGNNQVKKIYIKRTSPNRTRHESSGVGVPPIVHKSLNQGSEKPKRRPRPTSLITTVPSGSKTAQLKKDKRDGSEDDFPGLDHEHIVKSPPEPTRVKSPEQIVIRSPEPVNWTVPLDTGKTFTVTQNIREGDLAPRSYSEVRAWTTGNAPPPASVSAPTELIELAKANMKGEILTK